MIVAAGERRRRDEFERPEAKRQRPAAASSVRTLHQVSAPHQVSATPGERSSLEGLPHRRFKSVLPDTHRESTVPLNHPQSSLSTVAAAPPPLGRSRPAEVGQKSSGKERHSKTAAAVNDLASASRSGSRSSSNTQGVDVAGKKAVVVARGPGKTMQRKQSWLLAKIQKKGSQGQRSQGQTYIHYGQSQVPQTLSAAEADRRSSLDQDLVFAASSSMVSMVNKNKQTVLRKNSSNQEERG